MTSTVLPFPASRARPAACETRLARALDGLAAALIEQCAAVSAWRGALHDLKTANDRLAESLSRYAGELNRLGSSVSHLNHEARADRGSV